MNFERTHAFGYKIGLDINSNASFEFYAFDLDFPVDGIRHAV